MPREPLTDYTKPEEVEHLLADLEAVRKRENQSYLDCEDAIRALQSENERLRSLLVGGGS